MTALPVTRRDDCIELAVKVTPRANRARIDGVVVDAAGAAWLAVRVTAPPDGGRANEAVLRLVAGELDLAASAGAGSRWKRVRCTGDPNELERRAASLGGSTVERA